MGIKILTPGMFTTVQDAGRRGYQSSGFSQAGVMDTSSYRAANLLVDNEADEAVLEIMMLGPSIEFGEDEVIAVTGAPVEPQINDRPVSMNRALQVKRGDVLKFGYPKSGRYAYIAFAGGLDVQPVMGSRSTHTKSLLGGFRGGRLEAGALIRLRNPRKRLRRMNKRDLSDWKDIYKEEPVKPSSELLRVIMGPQEDYYTKEGIKTFLNTEYKIHVDSDRMGYRLEGEPVEAVQGVDIISDGIAFGAVQITPDGMPIIMLADRQTTGGYAKIANVISVDIPRLVQLRTNEKVRFTACSVEVAQRLYRARQEEFERIKNERFG
ncbi:biotin-dependent carboxyltransferase family protein [Clostridium sp. MCC353]|uniref:5-oxoprolinase subunit C family protein n=1 Tax=Clostridium sp. MCC353 TaxID=2592646 RepID=UPI001C02B13A|nr:biotin-dependent carboxyltransferase family protein [Clostridium sp. MCC353]